MVAPGAWRVQMEKRWPSGSYNLAPLKGSTCRAFLTVPDLVILEERIRQNLANLRRMRGRLWMRIVSLTVVVTLLVALHAKVGGASAILAAPSLPSLLGLLLLYAALTTTTVLLLISAHSLRTSIVHRYEDQCQRTLRQFNLQLSHGRGRERELTFVKRLPRRLAELLQSYRAEYRARKALRSNPGKKSK